MTLDTFVTWRAQLDQITGSPEFSVYLLFAGAIVVALLVHSVTFGVLQRLSKSGSIAEVILAQITGPTRLAMVLLTVSMLLPAANITESASEVASRSLKIGLVVLLGWSTILTINAVARYLERRHRLDEEDNFEARRVHTQIEILRRVAVILVVLLSAGGVLITFPTIQAVGVSLFASAGVAGIVLGLAARPILTNLIAGIQIALTQPIRLEDVLIVEGEWGWVERITTTYVVIRIWDLRRLVVPLSYFIEKPFENWTRESSAIIGVVIWHLDYRAPIAEMRKKLDSLLYSNPRWDGKVSNLQVIDTSQTTLTVRGLVSARNSPTAWDLRCEIREQMIAWLQATHPEALPRFRSVLKDDDLGVHSPYADRGSLTGRSAANLEAVGRHDSMRAGVAAAPSADGAGE